MKFQPALLLNCPKESIQFLCQSIVNLIEGNLTGVRRDQFAPFQKQLGKLTSKSTTLSSRRLILRSKAGVTTLWYIYRPCLNKFVTFFNEWVQKVSFCSKRTVGEQKKKLSGPQRKLSEQICKKEETVFPLIEKVKEELSSGKTDRLKNLRENWNFTIGTILRHQNFERNIRKGSAGNFTFQYNYCRQSWHRGWYKIIPSFKEIEKGFSWSKLFLNS